MIAPDLEAIRKRAVTLSAFFDEYLESVKPSEVHETVADGGEWIEKPTGDLVCYACAEDPSECGETCLRLMAADASMSTHDVPALCDEVEQLRAENAKLREAANAVLRDFTPEHLDLIGVSMAGSKLRNALADLALRGGA